MSKKQPYSVLLDTSFVIRLLSQGDPLHDNALGYYKYFLKISAYHKTQGDEVEWASALFGGYDKVYKSKVFNFSPDDNEFFDCPVECGGRIQCSASTTKCTRVRCLPFPRMTEIFTTARSSREELVTTSMPSYPQRSMLCVSSIATHHIRVLRSTPTLSTTTTFGIGVVSKLS